MDVVSFLLGLLPSFIVSVAVFYFQRNQKKRDAKSEERHNAQHKARLLSMDLTMASNKLSYAVAIAVKRGYANGEIEEGITAFEAASKAYDDFLHEQGLKHVEEQK